MGESSERVKLVFDKIEASGMTNWVGGGDTTAIGLQNFEFINSIIPVKPRWHVLDFGCGVGRLSAPLAEFLTDGQVVGVDLVPKMIEFCQEEIQPVFPNSSFILSRSSNPHYDQYLSDTALEAINVDILSQRYGEQFDLICALSVFTHLDALDAAHVLQQFYRLLRPGGIVFLTVFLDLGENPSDRKLREGETFRDCWPDPLAWVVYDQVSLLGLAHRAGLSPRKIAFGHWRVDGMPSLGGAHFQDAMVLCRPVQLPKGFDSDEYLSLHPDLLAANVDAAQHYLAHGYFEHRMHRGRDALLSNKRTINFHIDTANVHLIEGWAFSERSPVVVTIAIAGKEIAKFTPSLARKDVAEDHGAISQAEISGFVHIFEEEDFGSSGKHATIARLTITELEVPDTQTEEITLELPRTREHTYANIDTEVCESVQGPFPASVLRWLMRTEDNTEYLVSPWSAAATRRAVDQLIHLYRTSDIDDLERYFGLLARIWTAIRFVERRFPFVNPSRRAGAKDFRAVQSSVVEMFAISHHVAVLSSYGLSGPLLEFGCFKGFSTAALSHICYEVGLRMEVFDSFSGLPPSRSSTYREGDFAGSLDEVRRNVDSFGRLDAVTFHKGYFSDTVPEFNVSGVSCIWLDVDLEVSARDAMQSLSMLSPLGCVFSHECDPEWFVDGGVQYPPRGPEAVIPVILDAFKKSRSRPAGRFIHGQTGAFWDADRGIPVLPIGQLLRLKDTAIQGL